jgi:glycosyltransferase involved in cell wall biosynthesis
MIIPKAEYYGVDGLNIGMITPITRTGEATYSDYLIAGLNEKNINIEFFRNYFLKRPNIRVFLGSLLLKRILKDDKISIFHNLDNMGPFLLKPNKGIKNIITIHDIAPVILPEIHSKIYYYDFKMILPRLIKNTDSIIVPSKSTKEDLISKLEVDENKIDVIPLGVDNAFYKPIKRDPIIMDKYGIKGDYILYLGSYNPRKNLKNLILAFADIINDIKHDLVLVGPISKEYIVKIIEKYAKSNEFKMELLNRIILSGYVENNDLPCLYSSASALIFPSLYEGFGLPPLEAMACGTPVVTSNNSSIKEIGGNDCLYIKNPLNYKDISIEILKILNDDKLQQKLSRKGIKRAKTYQWDKMVDSTIEVYDKVSQI